MRVSMRRRAFLLVLVALLTMMLFAGHDSARSIAFAAQPLTAAPYVAKATPSLTIHQTLSPNAVAVGDTVTATLTVTNNSPAAARDVVATLPIPVGATAAFAAKDSTSTKGWRWTLPQLEGKATTTFTATFRMAQNPPGDAVLLFPEVSARGMDAPVSDIAGAVVVEHTTPSARTSFTPGTKSVLRSTNGRVEVNFSDKGYANGLTLSQSSRDDKKAKGEKLPPEVVGFKRGLGTFFLDATDATGNAVHKFDQPLTISVRYTPQQLLALGISEADVTIFWYDEEHQRWTPQPTTIDEKTHIASTVVDHFTAYDIGDGSSPSDEFIPSVKGWQTDMYTGGTSFQYPLMIPAGPAGLKPRLELNYNSTATDGNKGQRLKQQGGWAGKGWSLMTGEITLNKIAPNGASVGSLPNYYTLNLNGKSYDLVKEAALVSNPTPNDPTQWDWRSVDESFIRIRAYPNGTSGSGRGGTHFGTPYDRYKWSIWTKDGLRYDYVEDLWWGYQYCTGTGNGDYAYLEPYKWLLSSVTDTHGNTITYNYNRVNESSTACFNVVGTIDYDAYPTTITWGANSAGGTPDHYRMSFGINANGRPYDTQYDQVDNQIGKSAHETQELDTLKIESYTGSAWQLIREYDFSYAAQASAMHTDAVQSVSGGYGGYVNSYYKLTLQSIQMRGKDGTSVLPPMTFSYGSTCCTTSFPDGGFNRMTSFNNGQGGMVSFTYENTGEAQGHVGKLKNYRRVTSRTNANGIGQSFTWNYSYGTAEVNTLGNTLLGGGQTNTNPNSAALYYAHYLDTLHQADNETWLAVAPGREFRGHNYTTETDPNGTQTTHYFYQGEANQGWLLPGESSTCTYPKNGSNPRTGSGILTDPCFIQLRNHEFLKGNEYDTVVWGTGGYNTTKLRETQHRYGINFFDYSTHNQLSGLWRAFEFENQTVDIAYEGNGTGKSKTTNNTYETTYGNLTQADEVDETGATLRKTKNTYLTCDYTPYTTTVTGYYIVDRKATTTLLDGSNNYWALTVSDYDGTTTPGTCAATPKGDVTLERKYTNLPHQTSLASVGLKSADTGYGYDAWGNRTTTTTYQATVTANQGTDGYGTATGTANAAATDWTYSAPGNGGKSQTTTTDYDPAFHVFSVKTTYPSVNGATPMYETAGYDYVCGQINQTIDVNQNPATTAAYDAFCRLTQIVKPGDSTSAPTVAASYTNYAAGQPFHYEYDQRDGSSDGIRINVRFYDGLGRQVQFKQESADITSGNPQTIIQDRRYDGLDQLSKESQKRYNAETSTSFRQFTGLAADATERWTTYTYDGLGRKLLTTYPDATTLTQSYALGSIGIVETDVDAKAHKTTRETDNFERLRRVIEFTGNNGGAEGAWAAGNPTQYEYTPLDQLYKVQDALGNVSGMIYDSLGRKTDMYDPDMGHWAYQYDPSGAVTQQTDAKAQTLKFRYDELERLRAKWDTNNTIVAAYDYDNAFGCGTGGTGLPTRMQNGSVTKTMCYDSRARLTQMTYANGTASTLPTETFGIGYNSADLVTSIAYPTSETVAYSYDAAMRPTTLHSNTYGLDYVNGAQYTALDQPAQRSLGGVQQNWAYDVRARTTQIQLGTTGACGAYSVNFLSNMCYSYDAVGNVQTIGDNTLNPIQTQTFAYDERDRLKSAATSGNTAGAYNETYTFSVIGNINGKAGATYSYNTALSGFAGGFVNYVPSGAYSSTQPHAVTNAGGTSIGYDANGNMASGNGRTGYGWNVENTLAQITDGGSTQESYTYDADGERITRTRNSTTTFYAWGLIEQDLVTGGATRSNYLFDGQVVAVRDSSSAAVTYLHGDMLGSISVALQNGAVVSKQNFDPWGKVRTGGISQTTFNYTQQKLDGTGLLYYHARYYDPSLARFLSADTLVPGDASGKGGDLNTINLDVKTAALLGWNKQVEVRPLTVDFHESKFTGQLYQEDADTAQKGFYFQLDSKDKPDSAIGKANQTGGKAKSGGQDGGSGGTKCDPKTDPNCTDKNTSKTVRDPGKQTAAKSNQPDDAKGRPGNKARTPWGPANPQALNRYSYVLNNPLRYIDPMGHDVLHDIFTEILPGIGGIIAGFVPLGDAIITQILSKYFVAIIAPTLGPWALAFIGLVGLGTFIVGIVDLLHDTGVLH